MNPYLAHVPPAVRALSARVSDAVLLRTFDAVEAARTARTGDAVEVPGFGLVPAANISTVWGWLVDVVKSRHTAEWTAISDAHYADITARAASLQGCAVDAVEWDDVPDDVWDGKPSALELARRVLESHAVEGVRA
ncbi:hypothetical protein [Microbacterium lacus]|uniref:hypothetical protein n=1 Tax=Microbacterium lacus TaxID=415217 RepID=UPI0012FD4293|nr:hypothetical protein [Microbacterium lacus]